MSGHGAMRTVDVVLDAPASVSIYLQALVQAARHVEATAVVRAHEVAAMEASILLADTAGWSTTQEVGTPAPHRYESTALKIDLVLHELPEHLALHSHLIAAGETDVDELRRHVPPVRSRYSRVLSDALTSELGLRFATGSGALELDGVPVHLIEAFDRGHCRRRTGTMRVRTQIEGSA